jgi:hypothetical protein
MCVAIAVLQQTVRIKTITRLKISYAYIELLDSG